VTNPVTEGKMEVRNKGREDEEEYVPRYRIALKNREDTGNSKRKH
jgi:hypothetical protein